MKILILTTHLNTGGIASYVVNLAEGLKKSGNEVFVGSCGGDLVACLNQAGITHIGLNIRTKSELSPKIIGSFLKLKRVIKEEGIQIIHAQTRVTQVLAFLLKRRLGVHFIATCHGYFRPHLGRRIFPCWGERVIAISGAVKTHLIRDFKLNPEKVRLVYNGIKITDKKEFDSEAVRKKIGLKGGPVVGIVARLSPVKGHKYLIEAMKEVIRLHPAAQLLIVGDGPLKRELLRQIESSGIRNNVVIIPSMQGISEAFSVMSVYAAPSVNEGLGLALLEAQANFVPCVAFNTGGIGEVISDGVSGILVEPLNAEKLALAISRLLTDKGLNKNLAEAAYKSVTEKFSVGAMVADTIKVYEEALK